ncbi:MAG: DNA repair protein RecO [Candidatus Eisenbacteria sp.]|nr:DNA repair protein RecO [Candidatus Eisenbacteria bacterium]
MALAKTEGVILRRIRLGETSKILTVLTPTYGKIKLVAKGARKVKHRFGSGLEPFSLCSIVFYHREGRDLLMLSQCDTRQDFPQFPQDLQRFAYGSGILEVADKVVLGNESTGTIYGLVTETIARMAGAPVRDLPLLWWAYQLKLLEALGYRPELGSCESCGRKVSGRRVYFAPEAGGVRCDTCRLGAETRVSGGALKVLEFLSESSWDAVRSLKVSRRQAGEIENLLSRFLVGQYGDALRIRSLGILKSIPKRENSSGFSNADHAA